MPRQFYPDPTDCYRIFLIVPGIRGRFLRTDVSAIIVGCIYCGASKGEPCRGSRRGSDPYLANVHSGRIVAATIVCQSRVGADATYNRHLAQRARTLTQAAIRRGEIEIPHACEECGGIPKPMRDGRRALESHHDDYAYPLAVRFLCRCCHLQIRMKRARAQGRGAALAWLDAA